VTDRTLARPEEIRQDVREERFIEHMAGFRNILVHGYEVVDLAIVEEIVLTRLDDLVEFVGSVRGRL
jgi:uncharacterized protein YutE (UPF0331/DUF86 family)